MTIYSGFSHWKWWFSIVMLVYQRVSPEVMTMTLGFFKRFKTMATMGEIIGLAIHTRDMKTWKHDETCGMFPLNQTSLKVLERNCCWSWVSSHSKIFKSHWKSQNVPNTPQTVTAKPSLINHNIPQHTESQRKDNNILPPRTSCGTAATIKKLCRIGFLEFHSMLIKSLWQNATRPGKLSQFDMVNG